MVCPSHCPIQAAGRSAVNISRGTSWKKASTTAGAKFNPADPEVQHKITGFFALSASPRPKNPAERSSDIE